MQKSVNSRNRGLVLFKPWIGPLSGATTSTHSGPGSNGSERALRIPQSSSITGTSPSNCLVSYLGHSLGGGSYPSTEKQLVYSTAPAGWNILLLPLLPSPLWSGVVVLVRVSSIGQIDLFKYHSYSIGPCAPKKMNSWKASTQKI